MSNLKYRIAIIVALIVASAWSLFPRVVKERVAQRDGTFVTRDVRRVPLKKGLDLQGGMHLALEIDESKTSAFTSSTARSEALDRAVKVVRNRVDQFGVSEPVVQKVGDDRIIVELPGIDDPERAENVVKKSAFLQFQITDETGALERIIPRLDAILKDKGLSTTSVAGDTTTSTKQVGITSLFQQDSTKKTADSASKDSASSDSSFLNAGGSGPFARSITQGQIPGQYFVSAADYEKLKEYLAMPEIQAALPPGKVARWGSDSIVAGAQMYRTLYMLDSRPIITGESLIDAKPNQVPVEGTVVEFQLDNVGGRRFKNETGKHIKDYMAIVLDDNVMSAPVIQSAIGTRGQITLGAGGDLQEAQDLALVLRAGALPVPLKIAEVRTIGPSLGQDSIRSGMIAGIISIVLVIGIMLVYYRFSGLLAVMALCLYVLYTMAALAGFDAVLTLPGLAGFVLSIGIAVDANVLIFERIREELDRGKTVRTAIDEGFRHAMSAIVDSNVSTALTAAVLYQYGTGPVRGFAVTLLAGIAASMVTSIFVTKTFYLIWLNRSRGTQTLSI
jgi:preprotein translocase subunit SecD